MTLEATTKLRFQPINRFTVLPSLELSSTMKMEAEISSETLTSTYDSTGYDKPEVPVHQLIHSLPISTTFFYHEDGSGNILRNVYFYL
jgi:hypothetical protein